MIKLNPRKQGRGYKINRSLEIKEWEINQTEKVKLQWGALAN